MAPSSRWAKALVLEIIRVATISAVRELIKHVLSTVLS